MNYTPEQKASWDRVMALLKENVDGPSWNAWFKFLELYAVTVDKIIILSPSALNVSFIKNRFGTMILNSIDMVFDRKYKLEFRTPEDVKNSPEDMPDPAFRVVC